MKTLAVVLAAASLAAVVSFSALAETQTSQTASNNPTVQHGKPMQLAWCRWGRCGYGYRGGYYHPYYGGYYRHCWINRFGYRVCN